MSCWRAYWKRCFPSTISRKSSVNSIRVLAGSGMISRLHREQEVMFAGKQCPLFLVIVLQVKCFPFGLILSSALSSYPFLSYLPACCSQCSCSHLSDPFILIFMCVLSSKLQEIQQINPFCYIPAW